MNAVESCLVVRKVRAALPPNANTWADRAKGALAFPSSPTCTTETRIVRHSADRE